MSFLRLARRNAWRKPLRTVLLIFCVTVAFLIYGLTASFLNGTQGTTSASDDLLGVMSAAGRGQALPIGAITRIASEPGVASVSYMTRMRGYVSVEKNVVAVSAGNPVLIAKVNGKELGLTPELVSALAEARDRVLVGRSLAQAQAWSVGQRITVTSFQTARKDGSHDWRFDIAGIFEGETASTDTYFMLANYDYINTARAGTIRNFVYGRAVEHLCLRPRGLETIREENGKLGFRHCPFSWWHFPLFLRSVQDQIQKFCCRLIGGKMATSTHCSA